MQYSFVFSEKAIASFKERVPAYGRQRLVRRFIVEDYQCSTPFDRLDDVPVDNMIFPFTLSDPAIVKIDSVVKQAYDEGFTHINRSSVMRNVLYVINRQGLTADGKTETRRQTVQVEKAVIESLSHTIPRGERNITMEQFILKGYHPSSGPDLLKQKPSKKKGILIDMDPRAFDVLDQHIRDLGIKGMSRAALFRDVLRQLYDRFQKDNPRQKALEQQLHQVLSEYQTIAGEDVVRETVEKYLTD